MAIPERRTTETSRSGRFRHATDASVLEFSESVSFDRRLWRQDIVGSMAHARMLARIGVLSDGERDAILEGLEAIGNEIERGEFDWDPALEDVHMNIEAALTARVPAGAKLHTARSRNDQVVLDVRMWLREKTLETLEGIAALQRSLLELSRRSLPAAIPGYTHLQRAQPVPLAHHLLAYVEMLDRDAGRFRDSFPRLNVCPLGSGALAGSTLRNDREGVASELGFVDAAGEPQVSRNSMDAVGDRDFMVEHLAAAATLAVHLSRLCEDIVLWTSAEFGFLTLADAFTTGSSLMPQKKNPDLAELVRGRSGRVIGDLVSLLTLLKGLPMTYNRDLQEDKEPLFDAVDTILSCLGMTAAMLDHAQVMPESCRRAATDPVLLATDLADWLVEDGVPFREAHDLVGRVVALSEARGLPLDRLALDDLRGIDARFRKEALDVFSLERSLERRRTTGSPGWEEVGRQLDRWERLLEDESAGEG